LALKRIKIISTITQKELKELLHYDPLTGIFTWASTRRGRKVGNTAGYLNTIGYIIIQINGKKYKAHRLAWLYVHGYLPEFIDHENHIRDNNWILNLQDATRIENGKNLSIYKNNSSGVTGVNWHKTTNKWRASIGINNKDKHLGLFTDKFEAICTRKSADNKYNFHENHGR